MVTLDDEPVDGPWRNTLPFATADEDCTGVTVTVTGPLVAVPPSVSTEKV